MTTLVPTGNTNSKSHTAAFPRTPEASIEQRGKAHSNSGINHDDAIIERALKILEYRARYGEVLSSPKAAGDYCRLKLAEREHEIFAVLFLDAQNRLIEYQEIFRGTLTQNRVQ